MNQIEKLVLKQVNLYRLQEMVDHIVTGAANGSRFVFQEQSIKDLHGVAMDQLLLQPGQYRKQPVVLTNCPHIPPNWIDVPVHMATLCDYVRENWEKRDLIHLSAFVMWRLCWVHPFLNGNGRTARAASYMTMCLKYGKLLPSKNSVIEQIMKDKKPYYAGLRQADVIYEKTKGDIDKALAPLEAMMSAMLIQQIAANLPAG